MARDTVSTVVERVRRQLNSTVRMEVNVLAANILATDTTLTFDHPLSSSTRNGAVLSIGNELMRVLDSSPVAQEVTVIRGWQDSAPAAHALGAEILVNPRWTLFDIYDAMFQEIDSWSPDIFDVVNVEAATTDETNGVELAVQFSEAVGIIQARRNWTDDQQALVWPEISYTLMRGATADWSAAVTSGLIVRFTNGGGRAQVGNVLLTIGMPYTTTGITQATVLSTDKKIGASLLELIELGIKYRLMMDDESGRSARNAQDEPRRNEDVPPGAALSFGQVLAQRYERRRSAEVIKFRTRYPLVTW